MLIKSSYKKVLTSFLFFISLFIISISCDSTEPLSINIKPKIILNLIDVSCYEAWINIKTENITLPVLIRFKVNNGVNSGFLLNTKDTMFYYNRFIPSSENNFRISLSSNFQEDSTYTLEFNTLDTTIENYSWSLDTLGSTQSSVKGLWGNTSNNLWAVGKFTSSGPTSLLAHFDGNGWNYVYPSNFHTGNGLESGGLEGIKGIDGSNIWVVGYRRPTQDSIYGFAGYYDGTQWKNISPDLPSVILNEIWVSKDKKAWTVGSDGAILFYDGVNWTRQESGTTFQLWDIDGNDENDIYVVGYSNDGSQGIVLHYNGIEWQSIDILNDFGPISSVCVLSKRKIWILGGTTALQFDGDKWNLYGLIEDYLLASDGDKYNDIFFGGYEGAINHYNGVRVNKILNTVPGHENSYINDIVVFGDKIYLAGRGGLGFDQRGLIYTSNK